jgi:hypothetical protein
MVSYKGNLLYHHILTGAARQSFSQAGFIAAGGFCCGGERQRPWNADGFAAGAALRPRLRKSFGSRKHRQPERAQIGGFFGRDIHV